MNLQGKRYERNEKLQQLVNQAELTPDGADWFTLRTDPYHDFNRPVAGYPDADAYDTIVSIRNYELNVSKPAGLAAGNWDAHVYTLPFDATGFINSTSTDGVLASSVELFTLGLVNVAKDAAGGPLFPTVNPVASANFSTELVDAGGFLGVQDGSSRIIGMGIEVIDTTAQLYKQGALTAYKMPMTTTGQSQLVVANGAFTGSAPYQIIPAPPSTVAEAVVFRSTVQWETREGAYMVIGQQGVENPFRVPVRGSLAICQDTTTTGVDHILYTGQNPESVNAPPAVSALIPVSIFKLCNVTQSGIFLSGLANEATFKVRVRVYVERAPQRGETDLIPLSTPSAGYDYKSLALYSRLVHELPVAVPVGFNAKGDWWKMVLKAIGSVAPVLGNLMVPYLGPAASLTGNAVGTLATSLRNRPKSSKKKQANKQSVLINKLVADSKRKKQ